MPVLTGEGSNIVVMALGLLGLILTLIGVGIFLSFRRAEKERSAREQKQNWQIPSESEVKKASDLLTKTDHPAPVPVSDSEMKSAVPGKRNLQTGAPVLDPGLVKPAGEDDDFQGSRSLPEALANTEKSFFGRLKGLFKNEVAERNFEEIEEVLFTSDLGPQTVGRLMGKLEDLSRSEKGNVDTLKSTLKTEFLEIFGQAQIPEPKPEETLAHLKLEGKPTVWMIVGVNGAGKTTTIGKLSAHLAKSGKKVLVAAGDTFRAAAGAQLKTWTDRAQVEFFSPPNVSDPSAVAFDTVSKAKAQGFDIVLIDTAGRLHTQTNLMEELKKVKRVMTKVLPEAPHETLIVLDANSGQNALNQAREFHQALGLTGVVLTKMDGTAKGGVAVGLAHELKIPIRLIGVGEKIGDLRPFSATEFVDSILGGG